jgi:hypothetical protein
MRVASDRLLRRVDPDYAGGSILNLASSIARHFGVTTDHPPLAHPLPLVEADTVVLVIVDALGFRQLEDHLASGDVPTLERLVGQHEISVGPMTSTFPSTTPAALTTLHTGRTPAEHGMLGFTIWLPDRQTVAQTIHFRDLMTGDSLRSGQDLVTVPSLYQRLAAIGVSCQAVIPTSIAGSILSGWHFAGAQILAYDSLATLPSLVASALDGPKPLYVVVYWPDYDLVCHQHGPTSSQARETVRAFDDALGRVLPILLRTEDVLVLLTADHGQRPLDADDAILLNDDPALTNWLASPPMGERCARYLRVRPGGEAAVAQHFAPVADVAQMDTVWANGHFGGSPGTEAFRLRTGDLLVVPRARRQLHWAFTEADRGELYRGGHGGWTECEMLVPIVAARR